MLMYLRCIQEAVLAQRAVFAIGPRRMPYQRADLLISDPIMRCLQSKQISVKYEEDPGLLEYLQVKVHDINHFELSDMRPILPRHLPEVLDHIRSQKCTDERDRMFGVMGLFESNVDLVRVNYAEPVELLYVRIVDNYILKVQDLTMVSFVRKTIAEAAIEPELCLPSWCPNWTKKTRPMMTLCPGRYGRTTRKTHFSATAEAMPHVSVSVDLGLMTITGVRVATVQAKSALLGTTLLNFAQLRSDIMQTLEEVGNDCEWTTWRALFWDTIQADLYYELIESHLPYGWKRSRISRATRCSGHAVPNAELNDMELIEIFHESQHLSEFNIRLLLIIDKAPYLALGPPGAQSGDTVCALFGGDCLYVLGERKGRMHFIGECYVHGLMDGEIMQALDRGKYTTETFELY